MGRLDADQGSAVAVTLADGTPIGVRYQPSAGLLSTMLGVDVRELARPGEYAIESDPAAFDFSRLGAVESDLAYPIAVTLPIGSRVVFRFAPNPARSTDPGTAYRAAVLTARLGVRIDVAAGEVNQYLIRESLARLEWSRVGRVEAGQGAVVAVTLPDGTPIGIRYRPSARYLSDTLGVGVTELPGEPDQYQVQAPREAVDFSVLGKIDVDLGYTVGVTLPTGTQLGFRFTSAPEN